MMDAAYDDDGDGDDNGEVDDASLPMGFLINSVCREQRKPRDCIFSVFSDTRRVTSPGNPTAKKSRLGDKQSQVEDIGLKGHFSNKH